MKKKPRTRNHHTAAAKAQKDLRHAEIALQLDDGALSPTDKRHALGYLRIGAPAVQVALDLAQRHPDRFPDFDIVSARDAVEYEAAMKPVTQQLRDMADRIDDSIIKKKSKAGHDTLVLYDNAKSLAKSASGESMLPQVKSLGSLVRTRHKTHAAPGQSKSARGRGAKQPSPVVATPIDAPGPAAAPASHGGSTSNGVAYTNGAPPKPMVVITS